MGQFFRTHSCNSNNNKFITKRTFEQLSRFSHISKIDIHIMTAKYSRLAHKTARAISIAGTPEIKYCAYFKKPAMG